MRHRTSGAETEPEMATRTAQPECDRHPTAADCESIRAGYRDGVSSHFDLGARATLCPRALLDHTRRVRQERQTTGDQGATRARSHERLRSVAYKLLTPASCFGIRRSPARSQLTGDRGRASERLIPKASSVRSAGCTSSSSRTDTARPTEIALAPSSPHLAQCSGSIGHRLDGGPTVRSNLR